MVRLLRVIISTALEAFSGMWNPACGEFYVYSKKAACANVRICIIFARKN